MPARSRQIAAVVTTLLLGAAFVTLGAFTLAFFALGDCVSSDAEIAAGRACSNDAVAPWVFAAEFVAFLALEALALTLILGRRTRGRRAA